MRRREEKGARGKGEKKGKGEGGKEGEKEGELPGWLTANAKQQVLRFLRLLCFIIVNTAPQGLVAHRDKEILTYTKWCYVTLLFNLNLLDE